MKSIAIVMALLAAGCSESKHMTPAERNSAEARLTQSDPEDSIGRFQYHPAAGKMPAVVFDTATGYMVLVEEYHLEDKPKQIVWLHSVADEVAQGTPKRCKEDADK